MRWHTASYSKMTICYQCRKPALIFSNRLICLFGLLIWVLTFYNAFGQVPTGHKHGRIMSNTHELQQEFGLVQHTLCAHHAALRFLARVSGMQGTQPTSADLFELSSAVQLRSLSSNAKEAKQKLIIRTMVAQLECNWLKSANGGERFFATQWHWQVEPCEAKPKARRINKIQQACISERSVRERFSWQANSCISVYRFIIFSTPWSTLCKGA